ncbi:hypothetical protein [Gracilibacillus lacisalsi]|uniref:hypothetical protein n=1 Tax=Gracilibacillus lacisalsi TaxID=393087 RepID=UPI000366D43E|nr:hypothetical protein [Gracilibacillus lacisalsi]
MPQAWLLGPFVIKIDLVLIIIGFVLGFLFFYWISPYQKQKTKNLIDTVSNIFITCLISIWIGKIVLQFQTFLSDPVAILAYPANTNAFYLAVIITILFSKWRWIKTIEQYYDNLYVFSTVFLSASFIYSFLDHILYHENWLYLIALITLLFFIIYSSDKKSPIIIANITLIGWGLLQIVISTSIFQFKPHLIFYIFLVMIGVLQGYTYYRNRGSL